MPQEHSHGLGNAEQHEEKTYKWEWKYDQANSRNLAREAEKELHVHRWRCCKRFVTFPHFLDVDQFAQLVIALLTVGFLLLALFKLFPQFRDAQTDLRWGASGLLAKHAEDQWALCPDAWLSYKDNSVSGVVQLSNSTFPNVAKLNCTINNQNVSMLLPKDALTLLGLLSFTHRSPGTGEDAPYWCYATAEMINFFTNPQRKDSIRKEVTDEDGCLSKSQNHSCITNIMNMIPDWSQDCIGLYRWGYNKSGGNNTANKVLDWIKEWTLKDVLSFEYTSPVDRNPHLKLVVRMQNSRDQQRYDYVVPLAGIQYQSDSALKKFTETLEDLLSVSSKSEWAYVREAFLQIFQNTNATGGAEMYECLRDPSHPIYIEDALYVTKAEYPCYDNIDKNMWEKWQIAYDVYQKGIFKRKWWFKPDMNYDVFFANWTGLVGAVLSALFLALATLCYFVLAVGCSCWKLRKKQLRDAAGPKEVVCTPRLVPVQHTCNEDAALVQAEAGSTGSPVQASKLKANYKGMFGFFKSLM